MAFSFSNWFKTKPGTVDDETDSAAAATAAPAPESAPPPPLNALKSAVPNTVKPVSLHETVARISPAPIPLPSLSSMPRPMNAPSPNAARTISFPGSGSPLAPPTSSLAPMPVQASALPNPAPSPVTPLPDVPIHLELGDFVDKIPGSLLREGPIDRARSVVFKASDLYSDLARGRATVPASAIQALCPDIFQHAIADAEDVEVPLPLAKLVQQLAPALQQRKDQVAEENVGQIETPFLQVALEDNARITKAATPPPAPAPVAIVAPPAPVTAAPAAAAPLPPAPAPVAAAAPAPLAPLAPVRTVVQTISIPHQPAPAPKVLPTPLANAPRQLPPDLRPTQISAVRSSAESTVAAIPLAPPPAPMPIGANKRPPSTVRASVAGGKIRLSGPAVVPRAAGFGPGTGGGQPVQPSAPATPAHPIVVKPVAPLVAAPSADASLPSTPGTILKRTARIQIPAISVRPAGSPSSSGVVPKPQPGPLPPTNPASRLRPLPATEPLPTFRETPGGPRLFPTRPIPTVPPPSALRPLAAPVSPSPTVRTSVPAPPPLPFAPPPAPATSLIHPEEPVAKAEPPPEPSVDSAVTTPEPAQMFTEQAPPFPEEHSPSLPPVASTETISPEPVADHAENVIQMALAPILRALPNSFLAHADAASLVEDSARIQLPLEQIAPQLAHGRVSVSRAIFEAGLPAAHRNVLAPGAEPAEIPLPLQEIFQNLPVSVFTQREDQVVEEVKPVIPTPFSQKAEEDAQAFLAAEAEASAAPVAAVEPETPAASAGEHPIQPEHSSSLLDESLPATEPTSAEAIIEHPQFAPDVESHAPSHPSSEASSESSASSALVDHAAVSLAAMPAEVEQSATHAETPAAPFKAEEPHAQESHHPVETAAAAAEENAQTTHAEPVAASMELSAAGMREPEPAAAPVVETIGNGRREEAMETLRSVFMVEEDLDAKKVVNHVIQFPGLTACTVMFADGLKLAGTFSTEHEAAGFCAMAPAFFQKARTFSREMNLGELHDFTLHTERGLLMSFFMQDDICLSVTHTGRGFLPGAREKLQVVTRALAALYAPQH